MAKQSGIGSTFYVDQYDLSGDIGSLRNVSTSRAVLDVTDMTQGGVARIGGLRDGALSFTAFWDTAAGLEHLALRGLPKTDRIMSLFLGATVGSPAASMIGKQVNYAQNRGADGSLVANVDGVSNANGLEWSGGGTGDGMLTTGKQTFASGTQSGASIDLGTVDTQFGAACYLHVFSLTSGTPTVTIQDAATEPTYATISGLVFSPTVAYAERLQTGLTATIRRYVRVQVTGTYSNLVCAINFVRYAVSVAS